MYIGLGIILLMVFVLPFAVKKIEHNLEFFLFAMGFSATVISSELSFHLVEEIMTNRLIYFITAAVLLAGFVFKMLQSYISSFVTYVLNKVPSKVFTFFLIVILGLASSMITAIIAALLLVEIVNVMPLKRKSKINVVILACFSIGLGAALTPIGEPLSTIVISKLHADFWYLFDIIGIYVIPGILLLGLLGGIITSPVQDAFQDGNVETTLDPNDASYFLDDQNQTETYREVVLRSAKIFIFIIALELLGAGFKPIIDKFIIGLDSSILYFVNMVSAILDNATVAAAEINVKMTMVQIKAVLLGLLISGGMLIPGNIPNIISAHKLKITSKEWAKLGLPVGSIFLLTYFIILQIV